MSIDCEIVVPGFDAGARDDGAPKISKTGPLRDFLRDSDHYYRAVWKHARTCVVCDPAEILDGFLENRKKKHFGQTSSLLVSMAEKYRRKIPDRVPEAVVREYVIRSMSSWPTFADRVSALSVDDILRAESLYLESWRCRVARFGGLESFRIHHAFYEAQGYLGWLNGREDRAVKVVPGRVREAARLSRNKAVERGGWDLAVWLVTRHDWMTAAKDPVVGGLMANKLAEHVLDM